MRSCRNGMGLSTEDANVIPPESSAGCNGLVALGNISGGHRREGKPIDIFL